MEQQINEKEQRRLSAQRKNSIMKIVGVILAIVIIGGIVWFSSTAKEEKKVAGNTLTTVVSDDYIKGNPNAPVTLIEYLDFECEACGAYFPLVQQLAKEFPNDLKIAVRYYPLPGHKNGLPAALAVEAAARQGKFFEMHDLLFTEQRNWGEKPMPTPEVFEGYAEKLGLDMVKFKQDVASQEVKDRVERDIKSGTKLGNTGTPSFYLSGEKIQNPRSLEDFKTLIQAEILKAPKVGAVSLGEKVHEHADFAVYLEGKKFDFTQAKYQDSKTNPLDANAHLHDGNGEVTHKHRKGVTLGYFFNTLGMKLDNQCLITDDGKEYCNTKDKTLKMYVNGKENTMFGTYEFTDMDRILITYGDMAGVADQISSISDDACLYSEKCPERGTPPTENCVGGLGSEC